MTLIKQTILIVEDDKDLMEQYKIYCQLAITSLIDINRNNIEVKSANNVEQAVKIIEQENIVFISVDLALLSSEKNLSDADRYAGLEPGGMQILKFLHDKQYHPISIVVSGETLVSYPKDALQKYGVFGYYQKSDIRLFEEYQHALRAALFYAKAKGLISDIKSYKIGIHNLDIAKDEWGKAVQEAVEANASEKSFPVNLEVEINLLYKEIDSGSKIPSHEWTENVLRHLIMKKENEDWTLIQFMIGNFSLYIKAQQSQLNSLLSFISKSLERSLVNSNCRIIYSGIWRGELVGPSITAVVEPCKTPQLNEIIKSIDMEFRSVAPQLFTHNQGLMVAGPLLQNSVPDLKIRSWSSSEFSDFHELVDILGNPSS